MIIHVSFFQVRDHYKKSLSHQVVPELEELLAQQEYDLGSHTVSILELNVADLAEGSKWIGENKIVEEKEEQDDKSDQCKDDDDNEIVGMSLQEKCKNQVQQKLKFNRREISAKELKQEVKKVALNRIKNSKAFQQKKKLEQQKNRKQSKQKLLRAQKVMQKCAKKAKKKTKKKIKKNFKKNSKKKKSRHQD